MHVVNWLSVCHVTEVNCAARSVGAAGAPGRRLLSGQGPDAAQTQIRRCSLGAPATYQAHGVERCVVFEKAAGSSRATGSPPDTSALRGSYGILQREARGRVCSGYRPRRQPAAHHAAHQAAEPAGAYRGSLHQRSCSASPRPPPPGLKGGRRQAWLRPLGARPAMTQRRPPGRLAATTSAAPSATTCCWTLSSVSDKAAGAFRGRVFWPEGVRCKQPLAVPAAGMLHSEERLPTSPALSRARLHRRPLWPRLLRTLP